MATIAVEYGVNEEDALYLPCRDSELEEVLRAVNAGSSNEITIINVMWPEGLRMLNGRIVADDTPTSETELAGLIQKIKQEIVRAEEHDLDDFSQDDLGMR